MSKFFHLTKKPARITHQRRKMFSAMKVNIKIINTLVIMLIIFFGVSYLIQTNGLATKGYQIKELESKIAELKQEQADLELEALSLQSLGTVKEKVDQLGLVAVDKTDYLAPTPVALAR